MIKGKFIEDGSIEAIKLNLDGFNPETPQDPVNLGYLDSVLQGYKPKAAVEAASTGNIDLAGTTTEVDGYTLLDGDSVLLKDQTDPIENGAYSWSSSTSQFTRRADSDDNPSNEVGPGTSYSVRFGTVNRGRRYVVDSSAIDVAIGIDPVNFFIAYEAAAISGGDGVSVNGNEINVAFADGLAVDGGGNLIVQAADGSINVGPTGISANLSNITSGLAGSGLTANGSFIDLGGTLSSNVEIDASAVGNQSFYIGQNIAVGEIGLFSVSGGSILMTSGTVNIDAQFSAGGSNMGLSIGNSNSIIVNGDSSNGAQGLVYDQDYAANNVANDRWIVDKGYVDDAILASVSGIDSVLAQEQAITVNREININEGQRLRIQSIDQDGQNFGDGSTVLTVGTNIASFSRETIDNFSGRTGNTRLNLNPTVNDSDWSFEPPTKLELLASFSVVGGVNGISNFESGVKAIGKGVRVGIYGFSDNTLEDETPVSITFDHVNDSLLTIGQNYGQQFAFNDLRTGVNRTGFRLTGFGETDIDTEGSVDFSTLAFNSLVPKKYVDDAIAAGGTTLADGVGTIANGTSIDLGGFGILTDGTGFGLTNSDSGNIANTPSLFLFKDASFDYATFGAADSTNTILYDADGTVAGSTGLFLQTGTEGLKYVTSPSSVQSNTVLDKQSADGIYVIKNAASQTITALATPGIGLVYDDLRVGTGGNVKSGIRYTGFGEASITDETGVDYSTLVFNSLVPKKYVDDEILALTPAGLLSAPDYQEENPTATTGDEASTGVTLSAVPLGILLVFAGGAIVKVGDGVKTKDAYFSADGGTTAKALGSLAIGDELYWNGNIASVDLAVTDTILIHYIS